ncbi:unnamed protein product, partial [Didymodactylos carnosus]
MVISYCGQILSPTSSPTVSPLIGSPSPIRRDDDVPVGSQVIHWR